MCSKKNCIHNGVQQPVTNFYRHTNQKGGLACECKDCSDKSAKEYRKDNPEKVKKCFQKWKENNFSHMKEYQVNYYKEERKFRSDHWAETKIKEAKKRSDKKNIPFNIDVSDLSPLPKFCSVFGIALDYSSGPDRRVWASVDRIIPKMGYVKGNIRIISNAANYAKLDGDDSIFAAIKLYHSL